MRKGPWHKTKGNFGGAELEDSEYPHLREEMLSISKELFIEQEKQETPFGGKTPSRCLQSNHVREAMAFTEGKGLKFVFSLAYTRFTVDPPTSP